MAHDTGFSGIRSKAAPQPLGLVPGIAEDGLWERDKDMKTNDLPPLTTINELAEWLTKNQPKSAVVITPHASDPEKMHFIIVNATTDFRAQAVYAMTMFLESIFPDPKDAPPLSCSERRRMNRR